MNIKNSIDQFFDQEIEEWQVEDFVCEIHRQICCVVPNCINLRNDSFYNLKKVVIHLDLYFELVDYLFEKVTRYVQQNPLKV